MKLLSQFFKVASFFLIMVTASFFVHAETITVTANGKTGLSINGCGGETDSFSGVVFVLKANKSFDVKSDGLLERNVGTYTAKSKRFYKLQFNNSYLEDAEAALEGWAEDICYSSFDLVRFGSKLVYDLKLNGKRNSATIQSNVVLKFQDPDDYIEYYDPETDEYIYEPSGTLISGRYTLTGKASVKIKR